MFQSSSSASSRSAGVSRQQVRAAARRAASPPASASAHDGQNRALRRGLGKSVRKVDRAAAVAARDGRFASKLAASNSLKGFDDMLSKRISDCCRIAHADSVDLVAQSRANGDLTAVFRGLVTCQSVWSCPVCSARISARRRVELNDMLAWSRGEGHALVMLTLTAQHSRATKLHSFLASMKRASQSLRQSRSWRGLALVGSVSALEVTHSFRNAWHPHQHLLLVVPGSAADALAAVEGLRAEWLRSLGKAGLSGGEAAFQVQSASAAGDYIGKFGAAEELALGHVKQGRAGSRSPWQILADARDGDAQSAALFREYSLCFKGRRQLVWSNGLKALAGIGEVSDADAPDDLLPENAVVAESVLRSWRGSGDAWRAAARRYCALLDAAETGGCLDLAEFGTTDAMRWRADYLACQVLE